MLVDEKENLYKFYEDPALNPKAYEKTSQNLIRKPNKGLCENLITNRINNINNINNDTSDKDDPQKALDDVNPPYSFYPVTRFNYKNSPSEKEQVQDPSEFLRDFN